MKESQIQRACLDLLESLRLAGKPVKATRTNAGKIQTATGEWVRLCSPGWGDITASVNGQPVMIECKRTKGGVQSKEQKKCQQEWERSGGIYLLVDSMSVLKAFLASVGIM